MSGLATRRILAPLIAVVLLGSACGTATPSGSVAPASPAPGSSEPTPAATPEGPPHGPVEGTITYAGPEPSQGWDPAIALASASTQPMSLIYEPLLEWDEETKTPRGALAESWEQSDDRLTWTFKLRAGAKFSDGSAITAEDVKWTLDRQRESATMKGDLADIEEVVVSDPTTILLKLSQPNGLLPYPLSRNGIMGILSRAAVESTPEYFANPQVTSGAYVLKSYSPQDRMIFEANPNYWRDGFPRTKTVEWIFIDDPVAQRLGVEAGEYDITFARTSEIEPAREAGLQILPNKFLSVIYIGWDRTTPPFDDQLVRQAMAFAYPREDSQTACYHDLTGITYGDVLLPEDKYYPGITPYKSDSRQAALDKAGDLLDQGGWIAGPDGTRVAQAVDGIQDGEALTFEVAYQSDIPEITCSVLLFQDELKKIGVTLTPLAQERANYFADVTAGKFKAWHNGGNALEAVDFFVKFARTGGTFNSISTKLNDPEIDQLISEMLAGQDDATIGEIVEELDQRLAEELPFLPVMHNWGSFVAGKDVKGWATTPDASTRTWMMRLWIDE